MGEGDALKLAIQPILKEISQRLFNTEKPDKYHQNDNSSTPNQSLFL